MRTFTNNVGVGFHPFLDHSGRQYVTVKFLVCIEVHSFAVPKISDGSRWTATAVAQLVVHLIPLSHGQF